MKKTLVLVTDKGIEKKTFEFKSEKIFKSAEKVLMKIFVKAGVTAYFEEDEGGEDNGSC